MERGRDAFVFTCVSINNKIAIDTIVCVCVRVCVLIFYNYVHYADAVHTERAVQEQFVVKLNCW